LCSRVETRYNIPVTYKQIILSVLLLFFTSSCGSVTVTTPEPVSLPEFVTATLPPTAIPQPTQTHVPPTAQPTLPPTSGMTTSQINVRAETTTASQSYGVVAAFTAVQVFAKDPTGTWYRIQYEGAPDGAGWVRAEFVQVASGAIQTWALPEGSVSGLIKSGINVRSGPGKDYDSLGVLTPKDVVRITGKDSTGGWMQFDFPSGPDGKGWASAEFLQVEDVASLPTVSGDTEAVEAPSDPVLATANIEGAGNAPLDGDSFGAPLARVTLAPGFSRAAELHGEISNPQGDVEDWFVFTSSAARVRMNNICEQGVLQVEIWQAGVLIQSSPLDCKAGQTVSIQANVEVQVRLSLPSAGHLQYRLRIETGT